MIENPCSHSLFPGLNPEWERTNPRKNVPGRENMKWKGSVRCFTYMYIFSNSYYQPQCSFYLFSLQKIQLRSNNSSSKKQKQNSKGKLWGHQALYLFNYLWYFPPKTESRKVFQYIITPPPFLAKEMLPTLFTYLANPSFTDMGHASVQLNKA